MSKPINSVIENAHRHSSLGNISLGATVGVHAESGRELFQFNEDRYRHTVVIGRTGSGKSNHIQRLEREDIRSGAGCLILAAHEEDALYPLSCVPEDRIDDVVFADFGNPNHLPVMNPLDIDVNDPLDVAKAVNSVLELLKIDCHYDWAGPRFDSFVRMGMGLMLQPNYPHVRDMSKLETLFCDSKYVDEALEHCTDPELINLWRQEVRSNRSSDHGDVVQWFVSKVSRFSKDPVLRHVFTAGKTTIDIRDIVDNDKILIASIPESVIGTTAARTISKWIMIQLRDAIKQRGTAAASSEARDYNVFSSESGRKGISRLEPFFVYVDEFAKFADADFGALLAESRKFHVGFTLSFQTLSQTRVMDFWTEQSGGLEQAILGNVGSMVCYPLGSVDAETMSRQFDVEVAKLRRIERYRPLARLCMDNRICQPATLTVDLRPEPDNPTAPNKIVDRLIKKGVWTPAMEGAEEAAERQRQLTEAQDQLWHDLLWRIPDEIAAQEAVDPSSVFEPKLGRTKSPEPATDFALTPRATPRFSDQLLVRAIKAQQAAGRLPSSIDNWDRWKHARLLPSKGDNAILALKEKHSRIISFVAIEYGNCLPEHMGDYLKASVDRAFIEALLDFPEDSSDQLPAYLDLMMRLHAVGIIAQYIADECSHDERAVNLADILESAARLSAGYAKSYGATGIETGKVPLKGEAARALRVALNPQLFQELCKRMFEYAEADSRTLLSANKSIATPNAAVKAA